jgi:hypothetical protein
MASGDPTRRATGSEAASESELTAEALRRLEQRLDRASEAAERLIAEAAAAALGKPPPAGWQTRETPPDQEQASEARSAPAASTEIELLLDAVRALRDLIPPELQRRLAEALREVLLALRALIDWYLERTERAGRAPTEMRDIPIV